MLNWVKSAAITAMLGLALSGLPITFAAADTAVELHQEQLTIYGGQSSAEFGIGGPDGKLALSLDDGQTWGPAYLAGGSSHIGGYGYRPGTNSWINCNPNPNPCPNNGDQIIRATFQLPENYSSFLVTINALIDDVGYFSLNGNQFWVAGIETRTFNITAYARAGINNLDVRVRNGPGEVGINFRYDFSVNTTEPIYQLQTRFTSQLMSRALIVGSGYTGQSLEARTSQVPADSALTYKWLRDDVEIPGAINKTYTPVSEDIGKSLKAQITATPNNSRYETQTRISDTIAIADGANFRALNIYGGRSGSDNPMGGPDKYLSLSTDNGNSWGPAFLSSNATYLRRAGAILGTDAWVNCNPNEWACQNNLIQAKFMLPADFSKIRLKIYAIVDNFGEFSINGNRILGCTDFECQDGRDIDISAYAQPGLNTLQVKVVDYGGEVGINFKYELSLSSTQDPVLIPAKFTFPAIANPTVSGYHKIGSSLTSNYGTLPRGANPSYQWLRNGEPISGATGTRYTLASADLGKNVSFRLTLSANSYEDLVVDSEPLKVFSDGPELNPNNGHYYQFIPFSGNWFDAQKYAHSLQYRGMRGHLSTITSDSENRFVTALADGYVIYLPSHITSRYGRNYWVWTDGPEVGKAISYCLGQRNCVTESGVYTNWDTQLNQPDMSGEPILISRSTTDWSFDPTRQRVASGFWGDCGLNCAQGFVVEFDPNWQPFVADGIIKSGPNHYYQLVASRTHYADALRIAKSSSYRGIAGHLVTVESNAENSLVNMLASGSSFWIAGRDLGRDSNAYRNWVWDDGPNKGTKFMTCRGTADCTLNGFDYSYLSMSGNNGWGEWESVLQAGGVNDWEGWNDCSPNVDRCNVNSYIIEYELDPNFSSINSSGDWVNLDSNIVLPGQAVKVTAHFEAGASNVKLSGTSNSIQTLAVTDGIGNTSGSLVFNTSGLKNVLLVSGKKKFALQIWVPKVSVAKRSVKVGSSFTVSISTIKPGTSCTLSTSDGRTFVAVANPSGKVSFSVPALTVGSLVLNLVAGSVNLDSQGLTVTR